MRIKLPSPRNPYRWHRWFAWRPVRVGNVLVWLETIERRICANAPYEFYYEYRERSTY